MGREIDTFPALARPLRATIFEPGMRIRQRAAAGFHVTVVFTSLEATLATLRQAGILARDLGARIHLMVPQVVPYPVPLDRPPVEPHWNTKSFAEIAGRSRVELVVTVYLCRDGTETLVSFLPRHSLVLIGGRQRWWPSREKRLARRLRRAGHEVILTEME